MNVKAATNLKLEMVKLCKKHGINISESYGCRDHFIFLMDSSAPFEAKLEGLSIFEKYVLAVN